MIQFEVGKTYIGECNIEYTVITRSNQFITVKENNGDTYRAKIRSNGDNSPEYIEGRKIFRTSADNVKQQDTSPTPDTAPAETAQPPEYPECPDDCYSDFGGDNSTPLQDTEIDGLHEDSSAATQNDTKILPRLVSFYVNGYYLLPLEPEYMHYVRVIERSENTITVEDFANGDIHTLDISIQDGNYARCEYVKRPNGKGRAHDGYADKEFLGFKRPEHPRHPVFEIGKSYSATQKYLGEIYTLTFHVKKRVKLKYGKNDKNQNILVAGKLSGHPLEHPVDFAVRLYWDKPSDPEYFSQDGFTFNAENPDETTAPLQEDSQPEYDNSDSDALTLKLQNIPASTVNAIVPAERIERPEYASYPDTIPDEIPYHVIPAIDAPQHPAAVVPYSDAAPFKFWIHYLVFIIRLWLASNIRLSFSEAVPVIFHGLPRKNPLHKFAVNTVFYVSMGDGLTRYMSVIARGDKFIFLEDFLSGEQYSLPVSIKDNSEWVQIGIFHGGLSAKRDCRGKIASREHPLYTIFQPGIHYSASKKKYNGDFACRKILVIKRLRVLDGNKSHTLLHVKVSGDNITGYVEGILRAYVVDGAEHVGNDNDYFANARDALLFSETRSLKGNELHQAVHDNSENALKILERSTLRAKLAGLSVNAIKKIGKCLGLLQKRETGTAQELADTITYRLFKYKTTPTENSSAQQRQAPKTYTDCNRQIVIIFD